MEMRFLTGRAGTGKTYKFFEEIKERLNKNNSSKLFLLVPEQFTLQTEFDLITKMNLPGIMQLEVLSFERLAYKVLTEVGGIKKTAINELGKVMILRRLFDLHSPDLSIYQKASKQPGFLYNFSELVSELKKCDITPEVLNKRTELLKEDSMFRQKLQDISYMYTKFSEYMENRYTDDEDRFNLLIEKLDDADFLNESEIWIDGYSGFTSQQYRVIEKVINKAKTVNVSLTLDFNNIRDRDLFSPSLYTYDRLREICSTFNIKYSLEKLTNEKIPKHEELKHLEKELFSYPYESYEKDINNIKMYMGSTPYSEIEGVASQIVSLARDNNYRWKDIAVVAPAMNMYAPVIKRVFSEYEIPFFIDEKRSIMNNLIIKLILSALDMINRHFRYEDVFRYIKTGFADISKDEYELLENYALRYGIQGEKWFKDFEYDNESLEKLNEIRKRLISPFIDLRKRLKNKSNVSDMTIAVVDFLRNLDIEEKLDAWINNLTKQGYLEYVNENTQIWNIVMEVFEQLVEILGDSKMTLKEYINVLQTGFSEYKIGIIPPTIDQVLVGSLERSKSHDIKALFVVGANDGILPSGICDEGIILDDEKQKMKDIGISITSDIETRSCEERFNIYTMFSKPSEMIFVSFSLADIEGATLRSSIFVNRIKDIFRNAKIESTITMNDEKQLQQITRPVATFKYLTEYLRHYIDGKEIPEFWWDVFDWYYNNEEWNYKTAHIVDGLFHNNQESYIGKHVAKELYNTPLRTSISRLEKFISCPFSHFISYGLKPKERKEFKVEKFDIGTLLHNSVEKFSEKLKKHNLNWSSLDREKSDCLVEELVDELIPSFENNVLSSTHRYRYLSKKLKRVSKRAVWTLAEHIKSGDFTPHEHEFGFGEGDSCKAPPIILQLPDGEEVKIEGRIDRIDIINDEKSHYVKIIDYKSGNKQFSLSEVYFGLQMQLIVYLDAVLENKDKLIKSGIYDENEVYPAGVFYFKIDDPMINSDENDEALIEDEIMKKLKMDGLVLKDVNVIKYMDNGIEGGRHSKIIPAYITKAGELSKTSSAADQKQIKALISHVRNLIIEMTLEIMKGNIIIQPCKVNKRITCEFCKFSSICQFDTAIDNNEYRNIKKLSDNDVLSNITCEGSEK